MLWSSLCDYSDAYILVRGTIIVPKETDAAPNKVNKKVVLKNCVPFTNCTSRINNTQVDDASDLDVVIPMYNLIECSDNYSKTSEILWQFYRDVNNNNEIVDFHSGNATTRSLNLKVKSTGQTINHWHKKC